MALNIKDAEADRLARELAGFTGETAEEILREIRSRLSRLPVLDARSADEILGYDETGLPR